MNEQETARADGGKLTFCVNGTSTKIVTVNCFCLEVSVQFV